MVIDVVLEVLPGDRPGKKKYFPLVNWFYESVGARTINGVKWRLGGVISDNTTTFKFPFSDA